MADWPTTLADFNEMFGTRQTSRPPRGITGTNLMTPELLGYVIVGGVSVEVSYGTGFDHEPVFGLTWGRLTDGSPDPRDRLVHSLAEARTYFMESDGIRPAGKELP